MATAEFDSFATTYESDLDRALSVSGENKNFFAEGRVTWLAKRLGQLNFKPASALDYGCGIGGTTVLLRRILHAQNVVGLDVSQRSIEIAKLRHEGDGIHFSAFQGYVPLAEIDLVYCNGVFHHIPVAERDQDIRYIFDALRPGGLLALWENNAWNPGTRYVMSRCSFDRDAITLTESQTRNLVERNGFERLQTDYRFFFPRSLCWFRGAERALVKVPLGAQYMVLCRKA